MCVKTTTSQWGIHQVREPTAILIKYYFFTQERNRHTDIERRSVVSPILFYREAELRLDVT